MATAVITLTDSADGATVAVAITPGSDPLAMTDR